MRRAENLETRAYRVSIWSRQLSHRANSMVLALDDEARDSVINDLRHRTRPISDHGCAACHRFNHNQTERLRPIDREEQGGSIGEKWLLAALTDLADELDSLVVDMRLEMLLEVSGLDSGYLGRDA